MKKLNPLISLDNLLTRGYFPDKLDNLNEAKKEEVKHFLVTDKSGRSVKPIKLTEAEFIKRFDFDLLNADIDDDENEEDTIEAWLEDCYVGDVWENRTVKIEVDKIY